MWGRYSPSRSDESCLSQIVNKKEDELGISLRRPRRDLLLIPVFVVMATLLSPPTALAQEGGEGEFGFDFMSDAEGWMVGFALETYRRERVLAWRLTQPQNYDGDGTGPPDNLSLYSGTSRLRKNDSVR